MFLFLIRAPVISKFCPSIIIMRSDGWSNLNLYLTKKYQRYDIISIIINPNISKNNKKQFPSKKAREVVPVTIVHFVGSLKQTLVHPGMIDLVGSTSSGSNAARVHFHTHRIHGTGLVYLPTFGGFYQSHGSYDQMKRNACSAYRSRTVLW